MPNHYDDKDTLVVTYPEPAKIRNKHKDNGLYDLWVEGKIPEGSYEKMIKQEGAGS